LCHFKAWIDKPYPRHLSGSNTIVGTEEFIPVVTSGGPGLPEFRNVNGAVGKVAMSNQQREGELGEIDSGKGIDYKVVRELPETDDELKHYLDMLQDIKAFESEMTKLPEQAPPGIRRGTSRNMSRHKEKLLRWQVVREARHIRAITNYFTVVKKNGTLRLVVDARKINALMKRVPKMDLPTIQEVLLLLMTNKYFIVVDGRSYFYQFRISDEVGEFFCANLAAERGPFTTVALTRMPMGWNWAPAIAQKMSNTLLRDGERELGKAWIDNFIFGGRTKEEVWEKFLKFRARADLCNMVIDEREPPVLQRGEVLGIEVDLEKARYRMAESWVKKAQALPIRTYMTPREIYELSGNCIWASYVREMPLCQFGESIEVVRRVAVLIQGGLDWDTPLLLTREELDALGRWKACVGANEWQTLLTRPCPTEDIWTDASSHMWAFTNLDDKHDQGVFDKDQLLWHIFIKEAYAVHRSVQVARGTPRTYRVDNLPLVLAMKRKVSSNKLVNSWMSSWDWENISVEWVPTTEQKADKYTRGAIMGM